MKAFQKNVNPVFQSCQLLMKQILRHRKHMLRTGGRHSISKYFTTGKDGKRVWKASN
jgi:hypothetical protein